MTENRKTGGQELIEEIQILRMERRAMKGRGTTSHRAKLILSYTLVMSAAFTAIGGLALASVV